MTKLTQVLSYVEQRIAVLPLQGKQPLGAVAPRGVHSATTDAALVRSIYARFPDANVGIAIGVGGLGDVRVLDVDPRNGGAVELERLLSTHGPLPLTPNERTGSGGSHHFFIGWPKGPLRTKLVPGIELLGPGHYIVAAPSVTLSPYEWIVGLKVPFAPAPKWLVELASARPEKRGCDRAQPPASTRAPRSPGSGGTTSGSGTKGIAYARGALRRAIDTVSRARAGERNNTLYREALCLTRFIGAGELDEGLVVSGLVDAAMTAGLPAREAERTVESALRAGG